MFRLFVILVLLQVTLVFGQITFTREWVTGKRSLASNSLYHPRQDHSCMSFMPTIEFLLEVEEARKKECGPILRMVPFKPNTIIGDDVIHAKSTESDYGNLDSSRTKT